MRTIIEPFRIKSVEPIEMSTPEQRSQWLTEVGYNLFRIPADRVANIAYLIPLTNADHIGEAILHDGQVIEVVVHPVGQGIRIAQPHNLLLREVGAGPKELQGNLVHLNERALVPLRPVEVEIDVAGGFGRVVGERGVATRLLSPQADPLHEGLDGIRVPAVGRVAGRHSALRRNRCRRGHKDGTQRES